MSKKVEETFDPEKYVQERVAESKKIEKELNAVRLKTTLRQIPGALLYLLTFFYIFLAWYSTMAYMEEINGENSLILYFVRFMPIVIFLLFINDRNKLKK